MDNNNDSQDDACRGWMGERRDRTSEKNNTMRSRRKHTSLIYDHGTIHAFLGSIMWRGMSSTSYESSYERFDDAASCMQTRERANNLTASSMVTWSNQNRGLGLRVNTLGSSASHPEQTQM